MKGGISRSGPGANLTLAEAKIVTRYTVPRTELLRREEEYKKQATLNPRNAQPRTEVQTRLRVPGGAVRPEKPVIATTR